MWLVAKIFVALGFAGLLSHKMWLVAKIFVALCFAGLLSLFAIVYLQFHSKSLPSDASSLLSVQRKILGQPQLLPKSDVKVTGYCDPSFAWVKEEFQASLEEGREVGAQVAVYRGGQLMVSLSGGSVEYINKVETASTCASSGAESVSPLSVSASIPIFSSGKVAESAVIAMLADRGLLNYSDPISKHWPDFAQNGKENITVSDLMRHQGGLAMPDSPFKWADVANSSKIDKILARQHLNYNHPWDHPTKPAQLYHAVTRGMYANELVRRVDPKHRTLGEFFRDEVAAPHNLTFFLGINEEEWPVTKIGKMTDFPILFFLRYVPQYFLPNWKEARVWILGGDDHDVLQDFEARIGLGVVKKLLTGGHSLVVAMAKSMAGVIEGLNSVEDVNSRRFLSLELSSGNGLANAESMAKFGSLVLERKLFTRGDDGYLAAAERGEIRFDHGVNFDVAYTACGWAYDRLKFAGLEGWIGWAGASGSILQWNDMLGLSFAYTTVLPYARIGKPRGERLMKAAVRSVEGWTK